MEPWVALSCSQDLDSRSYPERLAFHPRHSLTFLEDPFQYYPTVYVLVFQVVSLLQVTGPKEKQPCAFLFIPIRATFPARFLVKITAVKVCKLILVCHVMWVQFLIPEPYTVNCALFNDCPSFPSIIHACSRLQYL